MSRYVDAEPIIKYIYRPYSNEESYSNTEIGKMLDSAPSIDLVRCAECRWSRPRTLKGETGYRCVFYRVDKAETGYCDIGEREVE